MLQSLLSCEQLFLCPLALCDLLLQCLVCLRQLRGPLSDAHFQLIVRLVEPVQHAVYGGGQA